MSAVKVGQVWRDKDKRRDTVIEILTVGKLAFEGEVTALVVGTEEERTYKVERLLKRWELVKDKTEPKPTKAIATTREEWLRSAVGKIREEVFEPKDFTVPEVHVSVGWPGGRGAKKNRIGECWPGSTSADSIGQIFVSPVIGEPDRVLETLVHEMVHAINHKDGESGHRGNFARIAVAVGLTGKMAATVAGPDLAKKLETIAEQIGTYPHAKINVADRPKVQKTYMVRVKPVHCDVCDPDYVIRMTQRWIDEGMPRCPHGIEMEET